MQQRQVSVLTRQIIFSPTQTERDFSVMLLRQVISRDAGNCSYKSFILRNFEGIHHIIGGVAREGGPSPLADIVCGLGESLQSLEQ